MENSTKTKSKKEFTNTMYTESNKKSYIYIYAIFKPCFSMYLCLASAIIWAFLSWKLICLSLAVLGKVPVGTGVMYLGWALDVDGCGSITASGKFSGVYGVRPSRKLVIVMSTLRVFSVTYKVEVIYVYICIIIKNNIMNCLYENYLEFLLYY